MLYKSDEIKEYFRQMEMSKDNRTLDIVWWLKLFDSISVRTGHGEITITNLLTKKNPASLHYYFYAGDFRLFDKSVAFYLAMVFFGKAFEFLNPKFRMNIHSELFRKDEQHIHIEKRSR